MGDGAALWDRATVVAVRREAAATTLRLELPETAEFLPGQYYLVRLAIPVPPGSVQQAYSVCSSPFPPSRAIELAVRGVEGGRASPALAHDVEAGDVLEVRGPYGLLTWTEADGGPVVLVGAGTGIAPLVSIVRYAAARGFDTPMTMLCSSRDRSTLLLRDTLELLERDHRWFTVVHTFTRSAHDRYARFHRRIDTSMLHEVVALGGAGASESRFYVAGPADMVLTVQRELTDCGAPAAWVYTEDHA